MFFFYFKIVVNDCLLYDVVIIRISINIVHMCLYSNRITLNEPRREKTGLRGFRPGLTQTGLYSFSNSLED